MESPRRRRLLILRAASSVVALALTPLVFADNGCDAVYRAAIKSLQIPHHSYSTTTHSAESMRQSDNFKRLTGKAMYAARTESTESIFDGKSYYVQLDGKWALSRISQADMIANAQESQKADADICTFVGSQTVGGQGVGVYKVHSAEAGSDGQLRIFQSNGLLQGSMQTIDGEVTESRSEYDNIQTPAVAK